MCVCCLSRLIPILPSAVHSQALHEAASRSVPEAKVLPTLLYSYYYYASERCAARHGSFRKVSVVLNRVTFDSNI